MGRPSPPTGPEILVIGYGSALRSDDSVGPRVAAAVGDWALPGVQAIAAQQLTPELVEALAAARLVIFVDARRADAGDPVSVQRIEPEAIGTSLGHASNPHGLLALAQAVFGACPPAWLVCVPVTDFAVGEGLSPTAQGGFVAALHAIASLLQHENHLHDHKTAPPCEKLGQGPFTGDGPKSWRAGGHPEMIP